MAMNEDNTARAIAFARLWAVACLFNLIAHWDLQSGTGVFVAKAAVLALAAWVVLFPGGALLAVLAVLYAGIAWVDWPRVNNHGVLMFVVHLFWVGVFLRSRLAGVRWENAFARSPAPALRVFLGVLYSWAVVHKLNAGFLDPVWSCASTELLKLADARLFGIPLSFLPSGPATRVLSIYGTLLIEAAIPLMLFFPRTRRAAIVLAVGFHSLLGFSYPAFSSMLWALLVLFLPADAAARLAGNREGRIQRRAWITATLLVGTAAVGTAVGFAQASAPELSAVRWSLPFLRHLFLLYTILLVVRSWPAFRASAPDKSIPQAFRLRPVGAILAAVLLLNGAAPYFGIKATQSFAMFSNLNVAAGRSNHVFIPASWQRFGLRTDLVTIQSSSDPVLDQLSRPQWAGAPDNRSFSSFNRPPLDAAERNPPRWKLPFHALKRRMLELEKRGEAGVLLSYERRGQTYVVLSAQDDPELTDLPWWMRKFLRPRVVPEGAENTCMW